MFVLFFVSIVGGIYISFFNKFKTDETLGNFKLTDYSYAIADFPSDKVLGSVDNAQLAKENAEVIWKEIYGESIKDMRPYIVSFDNENQVWLVKGTLQKNWKGGVPYILIQKKDGKVLAIWHTK